MNRIYVAVALCALIGGAGAQIATQGEAFNAGKEFAGPGSTSAGGSVNSTTGAANVPNFNTNAPESANFGGGKGAVGVAGSAKQSECLTFKASSALAQQECDAVNFVSKNPSTRPKFNIDKKTDPLIVGSSEIIKNPPGNQTTENQQCRVVVKNTPGTFTTETCTQMLYSQRATCNKTITTSCHGSAPVPITIAYDCPIPVGVYFSYEQCVSSDESGCLRYEKFEVTYAQYTMNAYKVGGNACYYFAGGSADMYASALSTQYGMSMTSVNQDRGRFEMTMTARASKVCPNGYTMVNELCLATVNIDGATRIISSDSSSPGPFQCKGGSILPAGILTGKQTYSCCTDTIDDGCASYAAQTDSLQDQKSVEAPKDNFANGNGVHSGGQTK